ncbi:MAG: hypothetical protein V3U37_02055 [Nitrospinaceae bacterium]
MSFEAFHRSKESDPWFQVPGITKAMEVIGKYFRFDFDDLPSLGNPDRMEILGGESIVLSYLLVPHSPLEN